MEVDPLLRQDQNPLQSHYSHFEVDRRILLSGHSHQAWPDVALQGQIAAFEDAARLVDDKWAAAFQQADQVRQHLGNLLKLPADQVVLGQSTHDLLLRFLSCLPWRSGARIVTTDGEFHSMRRQLARLAEQGVAIIRVPVTPIESLAQRMIQQLDSHTIAVMASAVMFQTGEIFDQLPMLVRAAAENEVAMLVDAYHAVNIVPLDATSWHLPSAFITGGGYKYLQAGEGNCFLTLPSERHKGWSPRPIITGWFAEFAELDQSVTGVPYGQGHQAFAGSTYDPVSHYRANRVFRFFVQQQLTPQRLRQINRQQLTWLQEGLAAADLPQENLDCRPRDLNQYGGFLSLPCPKAAEMTTRLREKSLFCDARNGFLRLGPAPYVSRQQIMRAIDFIAEVARSL